MLSVPTLVSLFLLAVPKAVYASPCVAFDSGFNLYAFGLDGKDYNASTQASWSSGEPIAYILSCDTLWSQCACFAQNLLSHLLSCTPYMAFRAGIRIRHAHKLLLLHGHYTNANPA